jgi:hypothetical protein
MGVKGGRIIMNMTMAIISKAIIKISKWIATQCVFISKGRIVKEMFSKMFKKWGINDFRVQFICRER